MKQINDPNAVLDPDKYYIALVHSHYTIPGCGNNPDERHDQAIWTRPMRAARCSSVNHRRTTAREILLFIAGFDEDLTSSRLDRLSLYELPTAPVYTMPTRDDAGKCLIQRV